jgi:DNA-binding protein HU-beta
VNKTDLIEALTERLGDKRTATIAVESVVDVITRAVAKGEKVGISGFGVFEKVDRAARTARNPTTGAAVKLKKTTIPRFRPGQGFKDIVSGAMKVPPPSATPGRAVTARAGRSALAVAAPARAGRTAAATPAGRKAATAPARSAGRSTAAPRTAAAAASRTPAQVRTARAAAPAPRTASRPAAPAAARAAQLAPTPTRSVLKAPGRSVAAPGRSVAAAPPKAAPAAPKTTAARPPKASR